MGNVGIRLVRFDPGAQPFGSEHLARLFHRACIALVAEFVETVGDLRGHFLFEQTQWVVIGNGCAVGAGLGRLFANKGSQREGVREHLALHAHRVELAHGVRHLARRHRLHPRPHPGFVEGGVEFRHLGDSGEHRLLFASFWIQCANIFHGAVFVMHGVVARLQLVPALFFQSGLGHEFHFIQAGWQAFNHVQ